MPYDETNLEDSDVKYLINSLKNPSNNFDIHEVQKKLAILSEEIDSTGVVLGLVDGIEYKLHFFAGIPRVLRKGSQSTCALPKVIIIWLELMLVSITRILRELVHIEFQVLTFISITIGIRRKIV